MKRRLGVAVAAGIVCLLVACSFTQDLGPLTSQQCSPGLKGCDNKCVGLDNPQTGCGLPTCAPCSPPNAVARCATNGQCDVASCNAGYLDCDQNPNNGCETQSAFDPLNCGKCGNRCATPANAKPGCAAGACVILACDVGFADCDKNPANGCEVDITADDANCGACGNACKAPNPACTARADGGGMCGPPVADGGAG